MTISNLYHNVYQSIILGTSAYSSTFLVGAGVLVRPNDVNPSFTYTGIASFATNATLTNDGIVSGSYGQAVAGHGGNGGVGVNLALAGDKFINNGTIGGGEGGASLVAGGYGGYGGNGGTGVNLISTGATSSNNGAIAGGFGGTGSQTYGGGTGGIGLNLSGSTLNNSGGIGGGTGGSASSVGYGATGGIGAQVGSGGTLVNLAGRDSGITGGWGGEGLRGGAGGIGVELTSGGSLQNNAIVTGGRGGNEYTYAYINGQAGGGSGGTGVDLAAGGSVTLTNSSQIIGGGGGNGFNGGTGGTGLDLVAGVVVNNTGSITGGAGGEGAAPAVHGAYVYPNQFPYYPTVYLNDNGTRVGDGNAATGGMGVDVTGGFFINSGTITGGTGGVSLYTYYGGRGGTGVYLNGGTLENFGHISAGGGGFGHGKFLPQKDTTGASGNYAVDFGPHAGTLVIATTGTFSGDIGGFAPGDTLQIANLAPSQLSVQEGIGGFFVETPSEVFTVIFAGEANYNVTVAADSTGTEITVTAAACYRRGTRLATPRGERPIESLAIGDEVTTMAGVARPIRWIGRRRYAREFAFGNRDVLPVRIRAGALADGVPRRDLWVSPEHAMFLDGALIPARDLINGVSIFQEESVAEVTYIHVEFDTHEVIYAEGALSESFADDESRVMFDNYAEYAQLFPHAQPQSARFCAPRIEEGYALDAVRRRLSARAGIDLLLTRGAEVSPRAQCARQSLT